MVPELNNQVGKVTLYACGGAGCNLGVKYEQMRGRFDPGFATVDVCYVDTSRSNVSEKIDLHKLYLIPNTDGSGSVRRHNSQPIDNCTKDILQRFDPTDLNIVLSSGGGGSGSVIAPCLVSELLARDKQVVVICIGASDTKKVTENTIATLNSYESIAKRRNAPVVMHYLENPYTGKTDEIDHLVEIAINSLCTLYSRQNFGLDTRDLYNFLHFDKVTSNTPQLAGLQFVRRDNDGVANVGTPISIITIAPNKDFEPSPLRVEYRKVGLLPEDAPKRLVDSTPINYVICDGPIHSAAEYLTTHLKEIELEINSRPRKTNLLSTSDADDNGLVF